MQINRFRNGRYDFVKSDKIKISSNSVVDLEGNCYVFEPPYLMRFKSGSNTIEEWNGFEGEWTNIALSRDGKKLFVMGNNCKAPDKETIASCLYEITLETSLSDSVIKEYEFSDSEVKIKSSSQIFVDNYGWIWLSGLNGLYGYDLEDPIITMSIHNFHNRSTNADSYIISSKNQLYLFWCYANIVNKCEVFSLNSMEIEHLGTNDCNKSIATAKYFQVISNPLNFDEVFILTSENDSTWNATCKIGKTTLESITKNETVEWKTLNNTSFPDVLPATARNWRNLNADADGNVYLNCSSDIEAGWYKLNNDLTEIERIEELAGSVSTGANCDITGVRLTGRGHTGR